MNFKLILIVSLMLMALFFGEAECLRKRLRRLGRAGRRIANAAQKIAPVVGALRALG
ncbi:cecropin-C-like [Anopheles coustani]|uniref:cecropin-C-like n=1 Tax=Anopheles coustani TaxID=139045 RepID=UPI002657DD5A|nr:cecropin-C-like [Anopheles coustani]